MLVKIAASARTGQPARVTQILVIDDDRAIGELIRDVLRDEGYELIFVEHLDQAPLDWAPALVITDLVGLHHYDTDAARAVLTRVNDRYPNVPIAVCTGHERALHDSRLGAVAVVRKPFTLEALVQTVAQAIAR